MNGHVCIVGGGGFIGTALRRHLAASGCALTTIGRSLEMPLMEGEQYYSVQELGYTKLRLQLSEHRFDVVVDLAYTSVPNTSYENPVKDFSENLYNVIEHLEFAVSLRAGRFVYVSSGGTVYGDLGQARPYRETDPNFPLSPYGITKMACERYVHMYHQLHGLPTLIVRPSNIYGPGQKPFRGQGLVATALGLAFRGNPVQVYGSGSHIRDYLYIDDFCTGLLALIRQGAPGEIYNLGHGEGHSILQIIDCIDTAIRKDGLRLHRQYHPERPFDVHYNTLDISKVTGTTGWQPGTPLSVGIRQTWEWMREYMANQ